MSELLLGPAAGAPDATFRFAAPLFLLGLLLLPLLLWWMIRRETTRVPTLRFASAELLRRAGAGYSRFWRILLNVVRVGAIALMVIALARPQYGRVDRQTYSEGIDIALVVDVSLSMKTTDFYPNRLEAAKDVLSQFVEGRIGDRLALIIFGTEAATLVPFTLDYGVLQSFIRRLTFNLVPGDSTAIGMGLATAIAKLRGSTAKSKVVVLLTDGENNAGKIDPLTAAEAARAIGVRVYTIGVGTMAHQSSPFAAPGAGIDEPTLRKIAELTNGRFFRATDNEKLKQIYDEINKLEKSRVESTQFDNFNDLAPWLLFPSLLLLLGELTLRSTRFVRVP